MGTPKGVRSWFLCCDDVPGPSRQGSDISVVRLSRAIGVKGTARRTACSTRLVSCISPQTIVRRSNDVRTR